MPQQQFHISTTSKKVYDLTDRKNFCSGKCLRRSNYLKVQLLTSPLWMRDNEVIPEFKLLKIDEPTPDSLRFEKLSLNESNKV